MSKWSGITILRVTDSLKNMNALLNEGQQGINVIGLKAY